MLRIRDTICIVNLVRDLGPEAYIVLGFLNLIAVMMWAVSDHSRELGVLLREAAWIAVATPFAVLQAYMAWNELRPYLGRHRVA